MSIDCRHCKGTGTCSSGANGVSCDACVNKQRPSFRWISEYLHNTAITSKQGLPCSICQGAGDIEARVWAFQSGIAPGIAIIVVAVVLILSAAIAILIPQHVSQVLTLLGTLAGSVVGFYFRGQHRP